MTENMKGLLLEDRWAPVTSELGFLGTDAASAMASMARRLSYRGMRVVAVPHTLREDKGRYGAVMFELYGPRQTEWLNYLRTLYVSNDGGRWVFGQSGEPLPFEKLELAEYLRHLGLSPFQEDFYLPQGAPAWLVEKTGPGVDAQKEYTLAQAREDF